MIGNLSAAEAARIVGGSVVGFGQTRFDSVAIDSRECTKGTLFVALKGDRFDGHDFANAAVASGAPCVLVSRPIPGLDAAQIVVEDPLGALQALGAENRARFAGKVAAVTGSAGKTTTRRMLAAIARVRMATAEPKKNFNNHIGVPLTLLEIRDDHECAVLELGCSDFGEIALLASLSRPNVALVTNVGAAHLEKLGDLEGVARAKGELFEGQDRDGIAVVNLDDPRVAAMPRAAATFITYGTVEAADFRLLGRTPRGFEGQTLHVRALGREDRLNLPAAGKHNAADAVAALAAAHALGCDFDDGKRALSAFASTPGRLHVCRGARGETLVDDTYNANPTSVTAALELLAEVGSKGSRIAILADMLELGEASRASHEEVGAAAARADLARLVTFGPFGRVLGEAAVREGLAADRWRHAETHEEAAAFAQESASESDAVLVKGSRGMRMENVVRLLAEEGA